MAKFSEELIEKENVAKAREQEPGWPHLMGIDVGCAEAASLMKDLETEAEQGEKAANSKEEQCVLSQEVVSEIEKSREKKINLRNCEGKKRDKMAWGSVVVEGKRRSQNEGTTILQKSRGAEKEKEFVIV
jgi:hypothetical protein